MKCPNCESSQTVKNGSRQNGKKNFLCYQCGRQFVENPAPHYQIPQETKGLVDKLLLEKIPLAGIARVVGVSERWLQYYVNEKYSNVPKNWMLRLKKKGRLKVECDKMWSFCGNKKNKQWIWLAIDRDTGEITGVYVGSRDRAGAQAMG